MKALLSFTLAALAFAAVQQAPKSSVIDSSRLLADLKALSVRRDAGTPHGHARR